MVARGRNCCGARLLTGYVTSPFTGTLSTTTLSLGELSRVGYCITLNGRPLNGHPPSCCYCCGFCVDCRDVYFVNLDWRVECDYRRLLAMRRKIGMLLLSLSMCTHDTAGNVIWHNLSGVDNDDFVAILVYMVTCLLKCYDQCLGVCDKPLLNAWTMVMVFENGIFRVRGRSQLSTFMKAYRAYARGGGLGPPFAFPPKINIYF